MKNYLILILLFVYSTCVPGFRPMNETRLKIFDCISKSEGISEDIKKFIDGLMNARTFVPIISRKTKMKDSDIEIFKACKKKVAEEIKKKNNDKE